VLQPDADKQLRSTLSILLLLLQRHSKANISNLGQWLVFKCIRLVSFIGMAMGTPTRWTIHSRARGPPTHHSACLSHARGPPNLPHDFMLKTRYTGIAIKEETKCPPPMGPISSRQATGTSRIHQVASPLAPVATIKLEGRRCHPHRHPTLNRRGSVQ
jgi:hypothetical protein